MKYLDANMNKIKLSFSDIGHRNLQADCKNCFGICCVALYFSASDGFPVDKEAGKPCLNLQTDFTCKVHKNLRDMGLKGCIAYDCFGAGQKVSQVTYGGHNWRQASELAKEMFDVFVIMKQLHEMLWYLTEALQIQMDSLIHEELKAMLYKTERLTLLNADALIELDVTEHRTSVNTLLQQVSEGVRKKIRCQNKNSIRRKKTLGRGLDLIGADLRRMDLRGENLSGAYLIAADLRGVDFGGANLIGADLRDADLRGANLANSIFLTQSQINTAKGDSNTKLPRSLCRPIHW